MVLQRGENVAEYEIEGVHGVGGMGVVYSAWDSHLLRRVALKVINDDLAADPRVRAAFNREAGFAAQLDHPNIVPVYTRSNADDPVLWLAMRLIPGGNALKLLNSTPGGLAPELAVELIEDAAAALQYAHSREVLHRDVKPANLLIESDIRRGHRALLADFGIARTLDSTITLTDISLAYAAPERHTLQSADRRLDVYSLGCTLYQLLTGGIPFPHNDRRVQINAHLHEPPPAPTRVRPELPAGLDGVIATAMAKRPGDRYPDCLALASAARHALTDPGTVQRVAADRPGPAAHPVAERDSEPTARYDPAENRSESASSSAVEPTPEADTTVSTGSIPSVISPHPGNDMSKSSSGQLPRRTLLAGVALAVPAATLAYLRYGPPAHSGSSPETPSPEPLPLAVAPTNFELLQIDGARSSMVFSSDGSSIATSQNQGTVSLWNVATRQLDGPRLSGFHDPMHIAFSPDGALVAGTDLMDGERVGLLWNLRTRQLDGTPLIGLTGPVMFSPDSSLIASVGTDIAMQLWSVRTRQPEGLPLSYGYFPDAFSPDGTLLASSSVAGAPKTVLWDLRTRQPDGEPLPGRDTVFSPDGTLLVNSTDDTVQLWHVRTRQLKGQLATRTYSRVSFSPDSATLATADGSNRVQLWNVETLRELPGSPIVAHAPYWAHPAFSPDGKTLAVKGSDENVIQLWDLTR